MKKYKGRKDLGGIAKMMGKIKNPSEETMANLKDISQVLADEEKAQSSSESLGGTVVTPVEPSEMEIPENASKKKEEKDKEKEKKKDDIERLKQGDALKKSKKAADLSINTSDTTDLDMDMGGSMVAKIFGKRKAKKAAKKYNMPGPDPNVPAESPVPPPEPTL